MPTFSLAKEAADTTAELLAVGSQAGEIYNGKQVWSEEKGRVDLNDNNDRKQALDLGDF